MNIRQLETFVAIGKLGSFSAAALRLNASQSTISARIKELEQTLGVQLFDRTERTVRLTLKGRDLLPHAQHAVSAFGEIYRRVLGVEALSGLVRIGVAEVVAISWLPKFITTVHATYPNLSIELKVLLASELLAHLQAGELDMAIIPGSRFDSSLAMESLGWLRFVWMAGSGFQTEETLTPERLRQYRILSLGGKSYHDTTMQEWLYIDQSEIPRVDICNSMTSIASLTAAGLGISLLPEEIYRTEIAAGQLRTITAKPDIPKVEMSVVYPRVPPNTAQKCLAEIASHVSTFEKSIP
jgi:DNA-binding transcriptional LysR family regulator